MGNSTRFLDIVSAKINKLLGRIEDPRELLDNSYEKQKELLANVKKGITELTTSKKILETQKLKLNGELPKLDSQAKLCMVQGNESLAKTALERKANIQKQIISLDAQITALNLNQTKLIDTSKVLEMKIEQLKMEKETIKAQYDAAEASVKINESLSGMGNEIGDIGTAIDRAKDKTDQMNAKSSAISELTESGVLTNPLNEGTDIDRQLAKAETQGQVDSEFRKMKRDAMIKNNDLNFCKV